MRGLLGCLLWGVATYFLAWFTLKKRDESDNQTAPTSSQLIHWPTMRPMLAADPIRAVRRTAAARTVGRLRPKRQRARREVRGSQRDGCFLCDFLQLLRVLRVRLRRRCSPWKGTP